MSISAGDPTDPALPGDPANVQLIDAEAGPADAGGRLIGRGPLRGLPVEVAVLSAVAFFVAAGFGIVAPAIPVFARSFGVSRTAAAAVVSAFALMRLVSALGVGKLVNRIGERLVLGTGIAIVAVSSALAGLAGNYGQLLALRGVGGIGSAMFSVSASSLLLGVTSSGQRGRAMGAFSGGFLVGGIAGPGLGGLITGWSLRAPFFLYAGTLAAAGAVGVARLPRHRKTSAHRPNRVGRVAADRPAGARHARPSGPPRWPTWPTTGPRWASGPRSCRCWWSRRCTGRRSGPASG